MKKLILGALLLLSTVSFGQALADGKYTSKVYTNDMSNSYVYNFTFKDGIVDIDGLDTSGLQKKTISKNNITTMTWINNGGVWTENQTYVFTKDTKSGNIFVYIFRVVQNEGEYPWTTTLVGVVNKTK